MFKNKFIYNVMLCLGTIAILQIVFAPCAIGQSANKVKPSSNEKAPSENEKLVDPKQTTNKESDTNEQNKTITQSEVKLSADTSSETTTSSDTTSPSETLSKPPKHTIGQIGIGNLNPLKINISKVDRSKPPELYIDLNKREIAKLSSLSKAKYYEIRSEWEMCAHSAEKAYRNNPIIQNEIAEIWLKCFLNVEKWNKKPDLIIAESIVKFKKDQKNQFYEKLYDLVENNKQMYLFANYLNQYLQKGKDDRKSFGKAVNQGSADLDLQDKINNNLQNKNYSGAVKLMIELINLYPGSPVTQKWINKPIEIYMQTASTGILNEMLETDTSRMQDWASTLHYKLDYTASLKLAERCLQKTPSSPYVTNLLWISGRSALFLGDYNKALKYFKQLTEYHYDSNEAYEAAFRSGLIHYRLEDWELAKKDFNLALSDKRDKYELNSLYWLYRTLVKLNSNETSEIRDRILKNYTYSYYGLKLNAEINNGVLQLPKQKIKASKSNNYIWLVGPSKVNYQKFETLAKAGFIQEAREKFEQIDLNLTHEQKWLISKKLSNYGIYIPAFKLMNEAVDTEESLKEKEFLSIIFPNDYDKIYKKEASKYQIDDVLLKSLTRQESAFFPQAVSSSNAMGLMQMIPPTAEEVARALKINSLTLPRDMFLPEKNIPMGTYYISEMIKKHNGEVPRALAAYNAGPHRLKLWIEQRKNTEFDFNDDLWMDELPWYETSFYVKAILRNTIIYKLIQNGKFALKPAFWQDFMIKK